MLYDQIVDYGQKGCGLDSKTLKMLKYRNGQKSRNKISFHIQTIISNNFKVHQKHASHGMNLIINLCE